MAETFPLMCVGDGEDTVDYSPRPSAPSRYAEIPLSIGLATTRPAWSCARGCTKPLQRTAVVDWLDVRKALATPLALRRQGIRTNSCRAGEVEQAQPAAMESVRFLQIPATGLSSGSDV
jgi:hypothetical protein